MPDAATPAALHAEPAEDILLLGEMLYDQAVMAKALGRLASDREHYRGNLGIVLEAATRTRDRCRRLLEEAEGLIAPRVFDLEYVEEDRPEASNIVDESSLVAEATAPAPALPHRRNGNGKPPTEPPKKAYSNIEDLIIRELRERGTATTKELLSYVSEFYQVPVAKVDDALANLRLAKKITTTRLGGGLINRIAS